MSHENLKICFNCLRETGKKFLITYFIEVFLPGKYISNFELLKDVAFPNCKKYWERSTKITYDYWCITFIACENCVGNNKSHFTSHPRGLLKDYDFCTIL